MLKRLLLGSLIAAFIGGSLGVAVADVPPELSEAQTMKLTAKPKLPAPSNLSWSEPQIRRMHPSYSSGSGPPRAFYDSGEKGWKLVVNRPRDSVFINFYVTLPRLIPLQFALTVKASGQIIEAKNCSLAIYVNNNKWDRARRVLNIVPAFHSGLDDNATLPLYWDIPQYMLNPLSNGTSTNLIAVELYRDYNSTCSDWIFTEATIIPKKIYSSAGNLTTKLDAQFALTHTVGGAQDAKGKPAGSIWTRGFGLAPKVPMIPAPTLYFNPGDLVNVTLNNYLNPEDNKELETFLNKSGQTLSQDEILDADHLRHEINIPHNLNNINLHVHGLHVDPSKDDVTIVITPGTIPGTNETPDTADAGKGKGKSKSNPEGGRAYDAPKKGEPDPTHLNPGSVSDQSVKYGTWKYVYRIPEDHLPGTHWYHPHKHGSTAAQVENGMAGSIVIQEKTNNAVVPFPETHGQPKYNRAEWESNHDQVFVIQEILNYGLQLGKGNARGRKITNTNLGGVGSATPKVTDVTLNGDFQPTRTVRPGQLERWRFINGGANHKAFSHIWLGKNTGERDHNNCPTPHKKDCAQIYVSAPMTLVAVDGIPLPKSVKITAQEPLLLGPGNRADVLVQFKESEKGSYAVFKNFPISFPNDRAPIISVADSSGVILSGGKNPVFNLPSAVTATSNPYLFAATGIQIPQPGVSITVPDQGLNYLGFQQPWKNNGGKETSIFPLIRVKEKTGEEFITRTEKNKQGEGSVEILEEGTRLLDVQFPLTADFPKGDQCTSGEMCGQWWQPLMDKFAIDGGFIVPQLLMHVKVDGNRVDKNDSPKMSTVDIDKNLARVSPASSQHEYGELPPYVRPVKTEDILQSRPVIFDISGVSVQVTKKAHQQGKKPAGQNVSQFTLNGRYFTLSDPIGNQDGQSLLQRKAVAPTKDPDVTGGGGKEPGAPDTPASFAETMTLVPRGFLTWTEQTYWVNPGYFLKVKPDGKTKGGEAQYSYHNTSDAKPTWAAYSGIPDRPLPIPVVKPDPRLPAVKTAPRPAVVNPGFNGGKLGSLDDISLIPGQPVNKTAEQWILINNSPVGHPFHIHINPFFVTEIGQLSYEQFADRKEWIIRAISVDDLPPVKTDKNGKVVEKAPSVPKKFKAKSTMDWMAGTWWDTIVVPPRGYVKLNYWINVPYQYEDKHKKVKVEVNSNQEQGIWVFHCHILRHEDRGMMMPVVTQLNPNYPHPKQQ